MSAIKGMGFAWIEWDEREASWWLSVYGRTSELYLGEARDPLARDCASLDLLRSARAALPYLRDAQRRDGWPR
jgi:hypothetical protein